MTPTEASMPSNSSSRIQSLISVNGAAGFSSGVAAVLAIVWSLLMSAALTTRAPYWFEHRFNHGIDSPVLALELARNQQDIDVVLQKSDKTNPDPQKTEKAQNALFWNTVLDCIFIPLYTGYIVLFGLAYHPQALRRILLILLAAATALADYTENARMFLALAGHAQSVYIPSLIKWSLLGLVLILLATLLLSNNIGPYTLPTRRLLGLAHIAAGALLLAGVVFTRYAWLALGAELFALTLLFNAIGLLGPLFAIQGTRQDFQTDFCDKRRRHQQVGPAVRDVPASGDDLRTSPDGPVHI